MDGSGSDPTTAGLYSLDLETGKQLWEFRTGGRISASPAVAAGRVIVGSQDGLLYCFGSAPR